MPDQAVEVERSGGADIGLHRNDFRDLAGNRGSLFQHAGGGFQAGAFGKIGDQLHFTLVVEWQQLHRHRLEVEHRAGEHSCYPNRNQKAFCALRGRDDFAGIAFVERTKLAAIFMLAMRQGGPGEPHHQPRGDDHRHKEAEDHRCRGVDRDRRHVRPHKPRDEQHRQQRGDDSKSRDDRRVADFGNGLNRGIDAVAFIGHGPVPGNVLDHHDRIVDEDTNRENQREQTDPVDGEAHHVGSKHGQHDRGRDDDCGNSRFAPTD